MKLRHALLASLIFLSFSIYSQQDSVSIDTVIITAGKLETPYLSMPAAVSKIDLLSDQNLISHLALDDALQEVPGLFTLNGQNFAQDLRISLRGFGARAAFGIRGIKVVVDGIPETTPDGQGQLDNISVADISSIEVLQGSSGAQYGNAAGGVMEITTLGDTENLGNKMSLRVGCFGMKEYRMQTSQSFGKSLLQLSGTHQQLNGYRDHSRMKQTNLLSKLTISPSDISRLTWQTSLLHSPEAQDPGGINLTQATEMPASARDRNISFDAGEEITHWKTSIRYEGQASDVIDGSIAGFISGRRFDGRLPFSNGGAIGLNRTYGGIISNITLKSVGGQAVNKLSLGNEILLQSDDRQRFVNEMGMRGDMTLSQVEQFNNIGIYAINEWSTKKVNVRLSTRYDFHEIKVEDKFTSNGDDSADRSLSAFNYSVGLTYKISERQSIYSNWSTSFETPTLSELSANPNGQGGFNDILDPMKARTAEIGLKGNAAQLTYSFALFNIKSTDELIPFELDDFPGRTFFRNAGKTNRNGIESFIAYEISQKLKISNTYSFSNFNFGEYILEGSDFSGNSIPGIPKHSIVSSVEFNSGSVRMKLSSKYSSSIQLTDSNSLANESFHFINLSSSYDINIDRTKIAFFINFKNLFNTRYFDNLRLNAFGGRYFEPGASRNFQIGVGVEF